MRKKLDMQMFQSKISICAKFAIVFTIFSALLYAKAEASPADSSIQLDKMRQACYDKRQSEYKKTGSMRKIYEECISYCKKAKITSEDSPTEGCDFLLRRAEGRELGSKACSAKACLYRLKETTKNIYKGDNFTFRVGKLPVIGSAWGHKGTLIGPRGTGFFEMNCANRCLEWEHVSGSYKDTKIDWIDDNVNKSKNAIVIRISNN